MTGLGQSRRFDEWVFVFQHARRLPFHFLGFYLNNVGDEADFGAVAFVARSRQRRSGDSRGEHADRKTSRYATKPSFRLGLHQISTEDALGLASELNFPARDVTCLQI